MKNRSNEVKWDCKYFRGDRPCVPHKTIGAHCHNCASYDSAKNRILIIKVGAAGDVLRTSPLMHHIRKQWPNSFITIITDSPEFIFSKHADRILPWNWETVLRIKNENFDTVFSLDKDCATCALAKELNVGNTFGFIINSAGAIVPTNELALRDLERGIFDDIMKAGKKHYVQQIFEVCGFQWNGEEYFINPPEKYVKKNIFRKSARVVGLNTGCGKRWDTRLWPAENWSRLAELLMSKGYEVVFLGGPDEDEKNKLLARKTKAKYFGVVPLRHFISIIDECDIIVSAVTMACHVAIALKKQLILLNNAFNKSEFHLYGRGQILEPDIPCLACYKSQFDENCTVPDCMKLVQVNTVLKAVLGVSK